MSFDVRADGGRALEDSCVSARVHMGGTPIAASHVGVTLVTPASATPRVRVRTNIPVNEPVVQVQLDTTCGGHIARTYTFLSELPNAAQTVAPVAEIINEPRKQIGDAASVGQAMVQPSSGARTKDVDQKAVAGKVRKSSASQERSPSRAVVASRRPDQPAAGSKVPSTAGTAAVSAAPRLVMEPLDVWLELPPALRLSVEPPRFAEKAVAQAPQHGAGAAEIWQMVNTAPEDLAALQQRAGENEKALKSLEAQLRQEKETGLEVRQGLKRVAAQRFPAWTVYGLAGLLALALLALAWQVRKGRRQALDAWRQSVALNGEHLQADGLSEADGTTVWPQAEEPGHAVTAFDVDPLDANATAPLDADVIEEAVQAYEQRVASVAQHPLPAVTRAQDIEHPEDLFDVLQQAEFFVSIGEHEQAVEGLRRHIVQHANSSPLAYLELLRLYHTLGRVSAFDGLRVGFEERFNAEVPSFATFQRGGKSLEDYDADLRRLESLWGSVGIVAELDRLMFRRDGAPAVTRFDLPAYEDLLLLLAIAQSGSGKGGDAASPSVAGKVFAATPEARSARPSLDTLAGDLSLEPSRQMQARAGSSAGGASTGSAQAPEIIAPDEVLKRDEDDGRFSLEPQDSGRRIVK